MTTKIAFLGLGLMGAGMAERLIAAGFDLCVYNRNPAKTAPLVAAGARAALSPREAAQGADIVMSMLADDQASRSAWLGEEGALSGIPAGCVCIESSTLSVKWVKAWAQEVEAAGGLPLDAPVTGSKLQAASGELLFLVGGKEAAHEKARPALTAMGRAVVHLGPAGSGAMLKLINNFLCGVQIASLAEAMALTERSGLDPQKALEILTTGAPGSPLIQMVSPRMANEDYTPNFLARLMAKDLAYAIEAADTASLDLLTAKAGLMAFQRAVDAGYGEEDMAAVIKPLR